MDPHSCFLSPLLSLSVNLCLSACRPKTNRLPIISPTKKKERKERKKGWQGDLAGIIKELQSRVCSPGEPLRSREEELFNRVEKEDGWTLVNKGTLAFHWLIVVRKGAFFIPC